MSSDISLKDQKKRALILNGNLWAVTIAVAGPLVLYQSLSHVFKIFDVFMASFISQGAVSSVTFLGQIASAISALGSGLALGTAIQIGSSYGSGDFKLTKSQVSTAYTICAIVSAMVLIFILPFTVPFLRFFGTPEDFIAVGSAYFAISLIDLVVTFFNSIYLAIERARGNSRKIMFVNILLMSIKFVSTMFFVFVLKGDVFVIALGSLFANSILLVIGFVSIYRSKNIFGFSFSDVKLNAQVAGSILKTSIPVIIEKFLFSYGKVIVLSMCADLGGLTVGALGISNNIGGLITSPQLGVQDGGATIISQNVGARQIKRAYNQTKISFLLCFLIGALGTILTLKFIGNISALFAHGNVEFAVLIAQIYSFEALASIALGLGSAAFSFFYGFGLTKITLLLSFMRIFVFRIPVLYLLKKFTDLGPLSAGVTMAISNISYCVFAIIAMVIILAKMKNNNGISFFKKT